MIKYFTDRQRKGVGVGKVLSRAPRSRARRLEVLSRAPRSFSHARELADVFEKIEKKNKTTSVYRLLLKNNLGGKQGVLWEMCQLNTVIPECR